MSQRSGHRVNSAPALAESSADQTEEAHSNAIPATRSQSETLPAASSPRLGSESEFEVISIDDDSNLTNGGAGSGITAHRS